MSELSFQRITRVVLPAAARCEMGGKGERWGWGGQVINSRPGRAGEPEGAGQQRGCLAKRGCGQRHG